MIWWLIGALVTIVAVLALFSRRRGRRSPDLGTLSDQWMAEQRMSQDINSNR